MKSIETPVEEFEHWYDEELHQDAIKPEDYCEALIEEMNLNCGDLFRLNGELLEVHTIDTYGRSASNSVVVSQFARDDPQSPHTETDEIGIQDLYRDWKQGDATPSRSNPAAGNEQSPTQQAATR